MHSFAKSTPCHLKIYNSIDEFIPVNDAVVTIGTFDGVHIGHQKIISRLKEIASTINGEVVVLTFFPHPRMVLFPDDHGLQLLNTMEEKKILLEKYGVDHLIIHPFSKQFSRLSSTEFVRDILVNKIGVKKLVIGYDHHFGRNREGSFNELTDLAPIYNFEVEQIPEQDVHDVAVSSTKIRNALLDGEVHIATEFLGYEYSLTGNVAEGNKIGRELGFPTANIKVEENYKLIPANGVYAVRVEIGNSEKQQTTNNKQQILSGALNIGTRPTFDNGERSIEVFIFDFDKDIYGETITITFAERLREELKFPDKESLIAQMHKDVENTKLILQPSTNQ
ncbi:MAG: bifunctional riboflavin kinase/FAD synthetase [Bacteroidia bacterium]